MRPHTGRRPDLCQPTGHPARNGRERPRTLVEPADQDGWQTSPGLSGKTVMNRPRERLHEPLVPPGRCPLYVRNQCYASARGDTS